MSDKNSKRVEESRKAYQNEKYREDGSPNAIPGINTPGIELPAFNPPVPNRAWTEMRKTMSLDSTVDNIVTERFQNGEDDEITG